MSAVAIRYVHVNRDQLSARFGRARDAARDAVPGVSPAGEEDSTDAGWAPA